MDGYQIVVINIVLITLCYSGVALAYDRFENFKRPDEMTIVDYINEFERLNRKVWSENESVR